MSDDAYGVEPVPPSRPEPPRLEPDLDDVDYRRGPEAPPYPRTVTAAGVIWIIYGCLVLLNMLAALVLAFAFASQVGGRGVEGMIGGMMCVLVLVGLFGVAFLFVGVQSVRGTARDALGNGVGSLIFGLLHFGWAAVSELQFNSLIQAGVAAATGLLLFAAGVLALAGRESYREWKRAQWLAWEREAAERRARRRFYR